MPNRSSAATSSLPPSSPPPSSPSRTSSDTSSASQKRPRSPLHEDEELPTGRKKRKTPPNKWSAWGRTCARVVDAYTDPSVIINTYFKSLQESFKPTELQTRWLRSYNLLVEHIPSLAHFVEEATTDDIQKMLKEMKLGQDNARQVDTNALKAKIIDMIFQDNPDKTAKALSGLHADIKTTRGFNNEVTGQLLCPVTMKWDDEKVKQDLRESPNRAGTTAWPNFFYPPGEYRADDAMQGLLRGEILVYAFKYIYMSPSSWNKADGSSRQTRQGNAKLAQMDRVTARSLAYVAGMVRFALSSAETNQKVGGPFDMTQFFWHLLKFLEDPEFEEEVTELLAWWDGRMFPANKTTTTTSDDTVQDSLTLLKAQKAAKKRAALANATNTAGQPAATTTGAAEAEATQTAAEVEPGNPANATGSAPA